MSWIEGKTGLDFAMLAGELMLKNGAETYRVSETIKRICQKTGFEFTEVFVFPTGIIVNGMYQGCRHTSMKQITQRDINLTMISRINNISRKYAQGKLDVAQGIQEINLLTGHCCFSKKGVLLAGAFASASATILLGGNWQDSLPALMVSAIVWLMIGTDMLRIPYMLKIYLVGVLVGLLSSLFVRHGIGQHLDKIIVGAAIPLMPGLALTSAVRDFISGDLLSGTMRFMETILVTTILASGVATSLFTFF